MVPMQFATKYYYRVTLNLLTLMFPALPTSIAGMHPMQLYRIRALIKMYSRAMLTGQIG